VEHAGIGVQLLWQLVSEMNQLSDSDATLTLTKHRKIASSFRDVHLYEIFQLSCTLLRNTLENFRNMNFEDQGKVRFRSQNFYNIFLLLNCFLLTLLSIIC
jgi:exportin-7